MLSHDLSAPSHVLLLSIGTGQKLVDPVVICLSQRRSHAFSHYRRRNCKSMVCGRKLSLWLVHFCHAGRRARCKQLQSSSMGARAPRGAEPKTSLELHAWPRWAAPANCVKRSGCQERALTSRGPIRTPTQARECGIMRRWAEGGERPQRWTRSAIRSRLICGREARKKSLCRLSPFFTLPCCLCPRREGWVGAGECEWVVACPGGSTPIVHSFRHLL